MRSRTILFASVASPARSAVIPFAPSAAAVRSTRAGSAMIANRRLTDSSVWGWGWVTIWLAFPGFHPVYLQLQIFYLTCLHMQIPSETDTAALLDRLVTEELPGRRGVEAWASLLKAHATLLRQLETDLEKETGLALADFDVLAQLAAAGGELRMTELAGQALISRSGMTRRVARLVAEGLVRRVSADADARGVVVALTDAGVARLTETAPVHIRGVAQLFVGQLDDEELAVLERALGKVTLDCSFG